MGTDLNLLAEALAEIPSVGRASARAARLRGVREQLPSVDAIAQSERALQRALDDYADGADVDVMAAARAVEVARVDARAAGNLRDVVRDAMQSEGEQTRMTRSDSDPALLFLRRRLEDLVDEVKQIAVRLGGVATGDDAARAGVGSEWGRLLELVEVYDQMRHAQLHISATLVGDDTLDVATAVRRVGYLADAIEHQPYWVTRRSQNSRQSPMTSDDERSWVRHLRAAEQPPFEDEPSPGPWPTGSRAAYLLWVCEHARPWMPTVGELMHVHRLAAIATSETTGTGNTGHLTIALAEYSSATNTEKETTHAAA